MSSLANLAVAFACTSEAHPNSYIWAVTQRHSRGRFFQLVCAKRHLEKPEPKECSGIAILTIYNIPHDVCGSQSKVTPPKKSTEVKPSIPPPPRIR